MSDDLILKARKSFEKAREYWADNHREAEEDLRFARLGEQWPEKVKKQREKDGLPCETFNKLPSFIRQVVNDARQNKPGIKIHPQDSAADPEVADIIQGLIRNIEVTSDADVAYDTAIECAVDRGMGYWRINTKYTCDDTFDQDIVIERVANPLTIYGDPDSTAADSSDWNVAWVITTMTKDEFEAEYPKAQKTDWDFDFQGAPDGMGCEDDDHVTVAEWWTREKVKHEIVALADGTIVPVDRLKELMAMHGPLATVGEPRTVETYKVTQRILTAAEVLKTVEWAGKYIPIVPVYGDEIVDEKGKRHFHSLIREAKGAQRGYNYMRNTGFAVLALQPKVPFIGPKGAFAVDENWDRVNDESIAYLEYDGPTRPERQPPPQGSHAILQEALNANDDMKAIIGIYDPSLGAKSNETSGVAIHARQRESDVSTFHFIDNLQRAIRHGGRILLDLIPKVYSTERIVRTLGEDMTPANAQIAPTGQPQMQVPDPNTGAMVRLYDLTAGKYDLTVSAGPNFSTKREEMVQTLTELVQAAPQASAILIPRMVKHMDFPDADEIAEELQVLNPANQQQQQMQQQVQQMQGEAQQAMGQMQQQAQEAIGQATQQVQSLQQQVQALQMQLKDKTMEGQIKARELELKAQELDIKAFEANVRAQQPTRAPAVNQ